MIGQLREKSPNLKRLYIASQLPEALQPLEELAENLWWSWNPTAIELMKAIDPSAWESKNYNPVAILDELSLEQMEQLMADKSFYVPPGQGI